MNIDLEFKETEQTFETQLNETEQTFDTQFKELQIANVGDIPFATKETAGKVIIGDNLLVDNGVVSVDVANEAEKDNTKPITSAAVAVQIGNIEILLGTI